MHLPTLCICKFVGDTIENDEQTHDPDLEGWPRRNLTKNKDL